MKQEELVELLKLEVIQSKEEGKNSDKLFFYAERFEVLSSLSQGLKLADKFANLKVSKKFPYHEPSELATIKSSCPICHSDPDATVGGRISVDKTLHYIQSDKKIIADTLILHDKIAGAWLGRAAGCMLGKPVEGWSREQIETYLKTANVSALDYYFPFIENSCSDLNPKILSKDMTRGNITKMVTDDDMNYPVIGLHILEKYGKDFTTANVGTEWLNLLPYNSVFTAEQVAYRNLINGLEPPQTATYLNPYREWIGAQIRADIWGWVNPGNPETAAEFAFRDASLTHTKNGIYSEMFFAAAIATSFVTDDIQQIIDAGLSQIPEKCRFAEMVNDVRTWHKSGIDWSTAWESLLKKWNLNRVHTINNAGIVLLALLYGNTEFGKTICLAVNGGLDTDCNGATAGSIIGIVLGAKNIPDQWISPFNDTLETQLVGYQTLKFSDLVNRTLTIIKKFDTK